jgi:20S proteasome alpha/beta subunit
MRELNEQDNLSTFKKAFSEMVVKSGKSWNESLGYYFNNRKLKEYTKEEVENVINSGSLE